MVKLTIMIAIIDSSFPEFVSFSASQWKINSASYSPSYFQTVEDALGIKTGWINRKFLFYPQIDACELPNIPKEVWRQFFHFPYSDIYAHTHKKTISRQWLIFSYSCGTHQGSHSVLYIKLAIIINTTFWFLKLILSCFIYISISPQLYMC